MLVYRSVNGIYCQLGDYIYITNPTQYREPETTIEWCFLFVFLLGWCRNGLFWLSFWIFWYEIDSMEFFQTRTWEIVNTHFTPGQSWNTCSSIAFRHIWPWGHQRFITPCRFLAASNGQGSQKSKMPLDGIFLADVRNQLENPQLQQVAQKSNMCTQKGRLDFKPA